MPNRLSTIDAEIDKLFQLAKPSARKNVALILADAAIASTQLGADVRYSALKAHDSSSLATLVEALDKEYFQLQEWVESGQASEEQMLISFSKARAANSILFFSTGDYCESIYEALSTTDDPSAMLITARQVLNSSA